jgi:hypothetical protein
MKKLVLAWLVSTLSFSSVNAPIAYAEETAYHPSRVYYGGNVPANTFYGYVTGQTTTFYHEYIPGYGYNHGGITIHYNGYATYPHGRRWQRSWPSAPAASW